MVKTVSETAFMYNGTLIDIVAMRFDMRDCGGAVYHKKSQGVAMLSAIAADIHDNFEVEERLIEVALSKYNS